MKSTYVEINGIKDVTNLVQKAIEVDGDVLCKKGAYIVDGKSILGLLSIDISTGVTVEYPEDAIDFENYISQFIPESKAEQL